MQQNGSNYLRLGPFFGVGKINKKSVYWQRLKVCFLLMYFDEFWSVRSECLLKQLAQSFNCLSVPALEASYNLCFAIQNLILRSCNRGQEQLKGDCIELQISAKFYEIQSDFSMMSWRLVVTGDTDDSCTISYGIRNNEWKTALTLLEN